MNSYIKYKHVAVLILWIGCVYLINLGIRGIWQAGYDAGQWSIDESESDVTTFLPATIPIMINMRCAGLPGTSTMMAHELYHVPSGCYEIDYTGNLI